MVIMKPNPPSCLPEAGIANPIVTNVWDDIKGHLARVSLLGKIELLVIKGKK